MPIVLAVKNLIQNAPFRIRFGQWDFGNGEEQAGVFTIDPAPAKAPNPVCVVTQQGGPHIESSFSCRKLASLEALINIRIWGDKERTDAALRELAWSVHGLFFVRGPSILAVTGWVVRQQTISAPSKLADSEGFPGYSLNLAVTVTKERGL